VNPEQPPQKLTIKMLRDAGATKLAEDAEGTINKLREIGAPDISEDKVIRTILKEAAKSPGAKADLANRKNPSTKISLGVLRYPLCVLVSATAWVFALGFAIESRNLVRIGRDGRILWQDGDFHYLNFQLSYPAFLPVFLFAMAAAIAVIAWHFRVKNKGQ
jgi:hypothetical protein